MNKFRTKEGRAYAKSEDITLVKKLRNDKNEEFYICIKKQLNAYYGVLYKIGILFDNGGDEFDFEYHEYNQSNFPPYHTRAEARTNIGWILNNPIHKEFIKKIITNPKNI